MTTTMTRVQRSFWTSLIGDFNRGNMFSVTTDAPANELSEVLIKAEAKAAINTAVTIGGTYFMLAMIRVRRALRRGCLDRVQYHDADQGRHHAEHKIQQRPAGTCPRPMSLRFSPTSNVASNPDMRCFPVPDSSKRQANRKRLRNRRNPDILRRESEGARNGCAVSRAAACSTIEDQPPAAFNTNQNTTVIPAAVKNI